MAMREQLERKLREELAPQHIIIIDDSHKHAGHAGWRPGGETHFRVEVVSVAFEGLSRVARQRLVHDILAEELAGTLHALQLRTLTPAEAARDGP